MNRGVLLVGLLLCLAPVRVGAQRVQVGNLPSHVIVDSCSGCGGGASGTIGAAVPATATPIGVKDNAGNLAYPQVDASGNLLVAVTGAGSGGTSSVDGSGYTAGASAGTAVIGARDDTAPGTVAEDKLGIARITTYRGLHVNVRDAAGAELGVSAAPFYITGSPERTTGGLYSNKVWMAGAVQHDVQVTTGLADNAAGMLTIDNNGALWVDDPATALYLPSISGQLPATLGQKAMAASLAVVIASNQSAVPVSGTVTTTPPGNASTNLTQIVGTAADVNSGTKSAGTLRVVLATDQPALTNKLLVTPDSVALPANQSVNAAQFGGTNVSTGTGAGGAGIPRVTVSNDSNVLATQSGTWTVQPGNTANSTAWKVDGSAVTQPVSGTVTANAGTNLNTSLLALEAGGNLASVKTNTDKLDIALSVLRDALTGVSARTLTDAYNQLATLITTLTNQQAIPGATTTPTRLDVVGGQTNDATPQMQPLPLVQNGGAVRVVSVAVLPLPLQPCNPVRRTNCQPKGY